MSKGRIPVEELSFYLPIFVDTVDEITNTLCVLKHNYSSDFSDIEISTHTTFQWSLRSRHHLSSTVTQSNPHLISGLSSYLCHFHACLSLTWCVVYDRESLSSSAEMMTCIRLGVSIAESTMPLPPHFSDLLAQSCASLFQEGRVETIIKSCFLISGVLVPLTLIQIQGRHHLLVTEKRTESKEEKWWNKRRHEMERRMCSFLQHDMSHRHSWCESGMMIKEDLLPLLFTTLVNEKLLVVAKRETRQRREAEQ
jgi:hypothetical protein